jgi:capsular exopolysaccharide synthesis family protein
MEYKMSVFNRNPKSDVAVADVPVPVEPPRRNPLLVVWQRRWIIVTCLTIAMAVGFLYLYTATKLYQGVAKVYVEQNIPRLVPNDPTSGGVMAGGQEYLWTQCDLIQSSAILGEVAKDPEILKRFPQTRDLLGLLRWMTSAEIGRRGEIISIKVKAEVPEDAAVVANAIVVAFTKYHESTKQSTAKQLLEILRTKLGETDADLVKKREQMKDFKTRHATFALGGDRGDPTFDRYNALSSVLTQKQLETIAAEAAYETSKAMMNDPIKVRQLLASRQFKSETAPLRAEMREMQKMLAQRSASLMPGNPEYIAMQESIKRLMEELAAEDKKMVEAYVAELEANVQVAKRYEQEIKTLLDAQRMQLQVRNTAAAEHDKLRDEVAELESRRRAIDEGMKNLDLSKDVGALNVRPVETAVVPRWPFHPSTSTALTYSLTIGALIGVVLAFLRDWTDQRLRSVDEIQQVLGLPVLGAVPHMTAVNTPTQRGMHLHLEPMSDVAESYRTVRTAVYFGQANGMAKTLLITSPAPGDGKTTLASNLAIAMAQAGNKILLLDADFRKPTQHKIFELNKRSGLSSVLAGEARLDEVIQPTAISGLDVLPCGPIPANPSEILNSQTFADLLDELKKRYDHVLLDSPPIMPVTDARILAASCDATVMSLRAEKSTRKGAIYARDMLHSVGSQILGVVINDVPRRKGIYGYYYSDTELYMYGYGRRKGATTTGGSEKGNGAANGAAAPVASKGPA